jgi:hypothetical protein
VVGLEPKSKPTHASDYPERQTAHGRVLLDTIVFAVMRSWAPFKEVRMGEDNTAYLLF